LAGYTAIAVFWESRRDSSSSPNLEACGEL